MFMMMPLDEEMNVSIGIAWMRMLDRDSLECTISGVNVRRTVHIITASSF